MAWSEQIGTTGNQVADAINGTVGESVRGVSAELANWAVTGKMSGDALRQVGFSIFTGWIQSIVQMGVQWLVTQTLIKTGLLTTDALQTTLLAKKTAEVNAANAATLPANSANAAAASVSSFGLAAVVGLAALLAVMAMFGGFRERGGDVAPGRAYVVGERRPEVFVPHEAGTIVPSVGSYIRASPGLGRAAPVSAGAGSDGGGAAGAAARPTMVIALADGISDVRRLKRQPGWEDAIVETVQRRRGEILS